MRLPDLLLEPSPFSPIPHHFLQTLPCQQSSKPTTHRGKHDHPRSRPAPERHPHPGRNRHYRPSPHSSPRCPPQSSLLSHSTNQRRHQSPSLHLPTHRRGQIIRLQPLLPPPLLPTSGRRHLLPLPAHDPVPARTHRPRRRLRRRALHHLGLRDRLHPPERRDAAPAHQAETRGAQNASCRERTRVRLVTRPL